MTTMPDFDPRQAHRFYSAHCYNETWRLLSLPNRSREQQDEMLALAYASSWHWSQREDIQPVNRSIALWLLSRVHAVLGDAPQARAYAEKCLQLSREASLSPFYIGYAHEALARAHRLSGD
jgi:ATP/maltotriose-dependent transcriptional regulator MalT